MVKGEHFEGEVLRRLEEIEKRIDSVVTGDDSIAVRVRLLEQHNTTRKELEDRREKDRREAAAAAEMARQRKLNWIGGVAGTALAAGLISFARMVWDVLTHHRP